MKESSKTSQKATSTYPKRAQLPKSKTALRKLIPQQQQPPQLVSYLLEVQETLHANNGEAESNPRQLQL